MGSSGSPGVLLVGFYPWSALGSILHGLVLTIVVAPVVLLLARPSPAVGVLVLAATPVVVSLVVYRLVAPGGFRSPRAKLVTGFALCSALVGAFCVGLVLYGVVFSETAPTSPLTAAVLGLLGLIALLVAVGASLDAVLAGTGST